MDLLYAPYQLRFTLTFVEIWNYADRLRVDSNARVTLNELVTYRRETFVHVQLDITVLVT